MFTVFRVRSGLVIYKLKKDKLERRIVNILIDKRQAMKQLKLRHKVCADFKGERKTQGTKNTIKFYKRRILRGESRKRSLAYTCTCRPITSLTLLTLIAAVDILLVSQFFETDCTWVIDETRAELTDENYIGLICN